MPYEMGMPERQEIEEIEDMEPDCWFRLRRNGDNVEILISRDGNEWTPRTTLNIAGDCDFMLPVIIPHTEYKPFILREREDEDDIT